MTSSNVNTHFCKGELQRRYIAMKLTLYTCIVCPTQVLRCFSTGHTHSHVNVFFLFFVSSHWYIAEAKCEYVLWNRVPDYFFCLFVDMHICTHTHTCKDICIHDSFYPHTIQFMHSSPTKIPLYPIPTDTHSPKPPLQHPTGLYNVNMYSTHTISKKKKEKKKTKRKFKHIFEKGCPFSFLQR